MGDSKILILPDACNRQRSNDYSILKASQFNPSVSVKQFGFPIGSISEIVTFGVLETTSYLRDVIKKVDYLLSVGGEFKIEYLAHKSIYNGGNYLRPLSFLMYEISICYGKRYKLLEKNTKDGAFYLKYIKLKDFNPSDDSIDKWTFGIVSDGRKNERVKSIVEQIVNFGIPEFEILICGPTPTFEISEQIRLLPDDDLYFDIRVPITSKKNRIIQNAKYNNLVIMHDRISFPADWFQKQKKYGNSFEILCNRILDEDSKKRRVLDWLCYDRDFSEYSTQRARLLEYNKWLHTVYVDGGFIVAKRHVLSSINGYNEALNWGEAEDVDLSRRLYISGYMTNINVQNYVCTETHRHRGRRSSQNKVVSTLFAWYYMVKKRFEKIRDRRTFGMYIRKDHDYWLKSH